MNKLAEIFPTMESFMIQFPTLNDYINNSDSLGDQIRRLNIIIIGLRNMLGWSNDQNIYTRDKDVMIVQENTPIYNEINKFKNKNVIKLLLKSVVQMLSSIMVETLDSPTLIIDEPIQCDINKLTASIKKLSCE
uniref:Uncharacterized protein n=1 Tax=viral metagenome TaxID=1070528 RepID=A0A6C0DU82_9ZZZZ